MTTENVCYYGGIVYDDIPPLLGYMTFATDKGEIKEVYIIDNRWNATKYINKYG